MGKKKRKKKTWTNDRYTDAIITFIDILGFKELVGRSEDPSAVNSALEEMHQYLYQNDPQLEVRCLQFSDSFIRAVPINSNANVESPIGILYHELLQLALAQANLTIDKGVFVRGGVTRGNIVFTDDNVFGPGFIRAYELESQVAGGPRIVVDSQLLESVKSDKLLRKDTHSADEELKYISQLIKHDDDDVAFLHYLLVAIENLDEGDSRSCRISQHQHHISSRMRDPSSRNPRVWEKYKWAQRYHNQFIERVPDLSKLAVPQLLRP